MTRSERRERRETRVQRPTPEVVAKSATIHQLTVEARESWLRQLTFATMNQSW